MMIMRPPQQGHGRSSTRGSSIAASDVSGSFRRRHGEQLAGARDVGRAVAVGKQSVVADAVEAVRQDVDEKAADVASG